MIESGRLYIAQPPLFRSKGNSIQYLKNQNEMENYLIEEGIKKLVYEVPKNNNQKDQISNKELISLLQISKKVQSLINQLTRRLDNKLVIEQAAVIAALKESSIIVLQW